MQTAYAEEPDTTGLITAGDLDYEYLYDDYGYLYDDNYTYNEEGGYWEYDYCFYPLYFDDYSLGDPAGITKGEKLKLKPYLLNAEDKKLVWTSSKTNIATVTNKGVVTAKKPGKTKITVTNKDDDSDYAQITVKVFKKPAKSKVYKKIMKLKSKYREGKAWGNEKNYYWKAANMYCYACIALSGIISDKVFGKSAPLKVHHNYKKIKVGDHIRIGSSHSVIVLTKNKQGVTVVEGNYNGRVHWGRYISRADLKRSGFAVWTRY